MLGRVNTAAGNTGPDENNLNSNTPKEGEKTAPEGNLLP